MYGMSAPNTHKLQSVQNSLTRVVLPSVRHLSASERLSYLHWLPVHYRIQFKIATLTYKTLATCQPSYLYDLVQVHQPSRALRSSTQQLLHVPYMSTAFSYSSPARQDKTTRGHRRRHYSASKSASPMSKLRWRYLLYSTKNSDRSPVPVRLALQSNLTGTTAHRVTVRVNVWNRVRVKRLELAVRQ